MSFQTLLEFQSYVSVVLSVTLLCILNMSKKKLLYYASFAYLIVENDVQMPDFTDKAMEGDGLK